MRADVWPGGAGRGPGRARRSASVEADKDCSDFDTQAQAQAFLDRYYPQYGDFARLDADGDLVACESLP